MSKTAKKGQRFSIDNDSTVVPLALSALANPSPVATQASPPSSDRSSVTAQDIPPTAQGYRHLPIEQIERDPDQPRHLESQAFSEASLQKLADSIVANGIIQPIVVRPVGQHYQLIAGERRWRAAQLAQLKEIPAIVKDVPRNTVRIISLIENLQREDLNPIEEAAAIEALAQKSGLSNAEIGRILGKAKSTIGLLRGLLNLDTQVQQAVRAGDLVASLARCLISLPPNAQRRLAQTAMQRGWNVRRMEQEVAKYNRSSQPEQKASTIPVDPNIRMLEERLSQQYGSPISIRTASQQKGKVVIQYTSLDDLTRILERMGYQDVE